ncbi:hypothetical protein MAR_017967, partial [Mya arenaria]
MDIESEDVDEDGMIHENDFDSDNSLPQAALVEEYPTSNPYSTVPMYLEPLNTDEIERIPSPEIPNSSEISHQPVRHPTDVNQQTAETYDRPTYEGATNDRYEQSQPASADALGVSLCYKSVGIQESRAGGDIDNPTQAGINETNGA